MVYRHRIATARELIMKNECGKTRKVDNPYEVWEDGMGWVWHVLKKYQRPEKELTNPNARWFVAAKSPYTYGSWEYGDTYVREITSNAFRIA